MIDIKLIKEEIEKNFKLDEVKGFFVSGFDKSDNLLFSKWNIFADKTLDVLSEEIFESEVKWKKNLDTLVVDVVKNKIEMRSLDDLKDIKMKKYWIFVWDTVDMDLGSAILPDSKEITDVKHAIYLIKQKINFSSSVVNIYVFTTVRFTLYK